MEKLQNELQKNINWEVIRRPNYNKIGEEYIQNDTSLIVRSDNGEKLHNKGVTDSFQFTTIAQLKEIANILSSISGFPLVGYDTFQGGKKVIAYLKSDKNMICGFPMESYLSIGNGLDGETSLFLGTSNILLRCANQWGDIKKHQKTKNTKNHVINRDTMLKTFEQYLINRNLVFDNIERFHTIELSKNQIKDLVHKIVLSPEQIDVIKNDKVLHTRTNNILMEVMNSVEHETNEIGNTAFGVFNGITHYNTHVQKQTHDVYGNLFGSKAKLYNKTYNVLNKLSYN